MNQTVFILCRSISSQASALCQIYQELGLDVNIIPDQWLEKAPEPNEIRIGDELLAGYEWVTSRSLGGRPLTAWSRALYHTISTVNPDEFVWFVEDDVAMQDQTITRLLDISLRSSADFCTREICAQEDSSDWYWWQHGNYGFAKPTKSFNPLCRCSYAHLMALKARLAEHGSLGFHEICLASVAASYGLKLFDWSKDARAAACFGEFRHRPEIEEAMQGICHPVKNPTLHQQICFGNVEPIPDGNSSIYTAPLEKEANFGSWAIDRMEFRWISRWCKSENIRKVVEFGPGATSYAFLGAGCDLHSFESDEFWLEKHRLLSGVHSSISLLPPDELPANASLPFVPDVVMVDGPPFRQGETHSRKKECEWAMEICGQFFLHDSKRDGERATLKDYLSEHFHILHIPSKKGLVIVTDLRRHEKPCSFQTSDQVIDRYEGHKKWGWYLDQITQWQYWLASKDPVRALEIGAFDGVSANLMLDLLFPHPDSTVHCIDPYLADPTTPQVSVETKDVFLRNCITGKHENSIQLYEGRSLEVLAWMINEPDHFESYDFIYVDGSHLAPFVLQDAVLAWNLLKRGGIMIFDDYGLKYDSLGVSPPKEAIDAFLKVYGKYVHIFESAYRLGFIRLI
jgi:predicted O-methyltransferase YrrM